LFGKKAKLLLSSMIRVEKTRRSNSSYEFANRQNVVLDDYGLSVRHNIILPRRNIIIIIIIIIVIIINIFKVS